MAYKFRYSHLFITMLLSSTLLLHAKNSTKLMKQDVFIDKSTALMWQDEPYTKAEEKAIYERNYEKVQDWQEAKNYCQNLIYAGFSDWYLPKIDELQDLYSKKHRLKNVAPNYYWSSSIRLFSLDRALNVNFDAGNIYSYTASFQYYVRCVRREE